MEYIINEKKIGKFYGNKLNSIERKIENGEVLVSAKDVFLSLNISIENTKEFLSKEELLQKLNNTSYELIIEIEKMFKIELLVQ